MDVYEICYVGMMDGTKAKELVIVSNGITTIDKVLAWAQRTCGDSLRVTAITEITDITVSTVNIAALQD